MGSSTTSVQSIVDYVTSMGELQPVIPAAGYSTSTALRMATDVMHDVISARFNWKFNSFRVAPWYTNSWQSDYPQVGLRNVGWIERVVGIDINNTSLPKPRCWPEAVRDLETSFYAGSPPEQVCWFYNRQLEIALGWPGVNKVYTPLVGAPQTPTNPPTAFYDPNGNILVLTTFGTTGAVSPTAPVAATEGMILNDGSCQWTVASPDSQGFRVSPLPPQSGVVFQLNVIAQKTPPLVTTMQQMLDPIPDDFVSSFSDGFYAYCYRGSPDPGVRKDFPNMRAVWLNALEATIKQGDRERDSAGFYPDRGVMSPGDVGPVGPANPYGYTNWIGR